MDEIDIWHSELLDIAIVYNEGFGMYVIGKRLYHTTEKYKNTRF